MPSDFIRHLRFMPLVLAAFLALPPAVSASGFERTAALCDAAAQRAARAEGVPLDVLRAITRVETGRMRDGRRMPWPWAVNLEGKGFWFDSEAQAMAYVARVFEAGARSFDIGCFQINYRWHGHRFSSLDAMFDPNQNAAYAARFLRELYAEYGSWTAAAGAYHSRTATLATAYARRFESVLAALEDRPSVQLADAQPNPVPGQRQALFSIATAGATAAGQGKLGSLVPVSGSRPAFIAFN